MAKRIPPSNGAKFQNPVNGRLQLHEPTVGQRVHARVKKVARNPVVRKAGVILRSAAKTGDARLAVIGVAGGLAALAFHDYRNRNNLEPKEKTKLREAANIGSTAFTVASVTAGTASGLQMAHGIARHAKGKAVAAGVGQGMISATPSKTGSFIAGNKTFGAVARLSTPFVIGNGIYQGVQGFRKAGPQGAAIGVGDAVLAGRVSASIDGYKMGGLAGALDAATFHVHSGAKKLIATAKERTNPYVRNDGRVYAQGRKITREV